MFYFIGIFSIILSLSILGKPWKLQESILFLHRKIMKNLRTKYHWGVNTEQENPILPVLQHKQVECLSKNWLEKVMKLIIIDTITYPSKWHTFLNWPATKKLLLMIFATFCCKNSCNSTFISRFLISKKCHEVNCNWYYHVLTLKFKWHTFH